MKLDAKVLFPDLKIRFNGKSTKEASAIALSRTAQQAINVILDKTKKGVDAKDRPFKPYSRKGSGDGYYGWRKRKGKSLKPNLTDKGEMLAAMTSRVQGTKATIFFSSAAESKKAAFNQESREFFKLSRKTREELTKFFIRNLT